MVHDPGKAGARSRRGLVDTLPQRLKVIGDDDDFSDNASMIMPTKDNSQSENLQSYIVNVTLIRIVRKQILITMIVVKNHLKPVHVDDGGGDGDDDTEQRREKADAATEFDLEQNILKSSGFNLY